MGRDAQKQRKLVSKPATLPGTPSGEHSVAMAKEDACRCGRCTNEALAKARGES